MSMCGVAGARSWGHRPRQRVDEHNVRGEAPVGQDGLGHVSKQCGLPTDSEGEQP